MEKILRLNILVISQYFWHENFRINNLAIKLSEKVANIKVLTAYPNYLDGEIYGDFKLTKSKNASIFYFTSFRKYSKFS